MGTWNHFCGLTEVVTNCYDTFYEVLLHFFLLLTWELDTSGNSFMSMTFINHFPLFQLWCMKAFTLVRFQKYLKLMIPISSFKTYYEVFSWEKSHLCPVSGFWSFRIPGCRAEICLLPIPTFSLRCPSTKLDSFVCY